MTHHDDDPFREVTVLGGMGTEATAGGTPKTALALIDRHVEVLTTDGTHPSGVQPCQSHQGRVTLPGWVELTEDELDVVTVDLTD